MFFRVFVFGCIPYASVCVRLKWSYLSQHSSPMTGGMEGGRGGGSGPKRVQWQPSGDLAATVRVEV